MVRRPSTGRRLSITLIGLFKRKRKKIGLTLEQLASLSGIDVEILTRMEANPDAARSDHRLLYDHAVVLARALGLSPSEMPGLRSASRAEEQDAPLRALQKQLLAAPLLLFEGRSGECYHGASDRLATSDHFTIKIGDSSLEPMFAHGALLGFSSTTPGKDGDLVLLRSLTIGDLALRRVDGGVLTGLSPWMPALVHDRKEWHPLGRLEVVLPRGLI